MRLLRQNELGVIVLTRDWTGQPPPPYAILSHTWLEDNEKEIDFKDVNNNIEDMKLAKPESYAKIKFCAERAALDGLDYFWIDSCCIYRESSTELQYAITSMFKWYRNATRCYAYISDLSIGPSATDSSSEQPPPTALWESVFRKCRWFTRGWTLQELLAPPHVGFYSREGIFLGDKQSLGWIIQEATGIPLEALQGKDLENFSVDERRSWAANRTTKRVEDGAYCLSGIFRVTMIYNYGEGEESAFERLEYEVDKKFAKHSTLDEYLTQLPAVSEAAFNSMQNRHQPNCLPNTRTKLLNQIHKWIEGSDDGRICWLNGMAGIGKSTVARTVARTYYQSGELGASFFFSKDSSNLTKADKMVTTLARQLANRRPEVKRYICDAIRLQGDIKELGIRDQWEQLIIKPLTKMTIHPQRPIFLFIIDALDECDEESDIRLILRLMGGVKSPNTVRLRILITGRPDGPVRRGFEEISETQKFVLHEIASDQVNHDLNVFIEHEFTEMRNYHKLDMDWPGVRVIQRLVEISCGLFIWASTACRFIFQAKKSRLVMQRINNILHGFATSGGSVKALDQIYTTVLQAVIDEEDVDDVDEGELYAMLRRVLGSIVTLRSPLCTRSLSRLLGESTNDVQETLDDLHTILHISTDPNEPVRLHHPTFRDFLLDKERCVDRNFLVDEKEAQRALADSCIDVMSRMLTKNICGLGSPGSPVTDLSPEVIQKSIPPELEYACLYWVEHYSRSNLVLRDGDAINEFFKAKFLYWLETMSIMGKITEMVAILRNYHALLRPQYNVRQIPFVKDARRLLFKSQNTIREFPLQVYGSAVIFIPPTNELRAHFWGSTCPPWQSVNVHILKAKDEFNYVSDLSFTPDSRRIASGSNFEAARMWDVSSRATLRKFEGGATDKISSVAISHNGNLLAAGSDDWTVMIWDTQMGKLIHTLKSHLGWVNSVAFSPTDTLLASGAMDKTVLLWDPYTGDMVKRIPNQSSNVNSLAFSPDGKKVATGAVDEVVRVWTTSGALTMELTGHTGPVNAVRFSPRGKRIISGSDDMAIKVWDAASGLEIMHLSGHKKKVWAVAFSPDERSIASGSEDKTICVWDATNGAPIHTLVDHKSGINSVVFSPNNQLLATSSFDDEVRLWQSGTWNLIGKLDDFDEDMKSGTLVAQRPYLPAGGNLIADSLEKQGGHSEKVTALISSSKDEWVASGSQDSTVILWYQGVEHWTLNGHTGAINDLAFSPDTELLASASADKTARVWRVKTGGIVHIVEGYSGGVLSVCFSSSGRSLATCSADGTTRICDPVTGAILNIFDGHVGPVYGISFSPDDQLMVTWSRDTTCHLWSLTTGTISASLRGHSGSINSVAFSPNGRLLVSASEDASVKLWTLEGNPYAEVTTGGLPASVAAYSPDNKFLAIGSTRGKFYLLDLEKMTEICSIDMGIVVHRLCFSSCGRYIETDRGVLDVGRYLDLPPPSPARKHCIFTPWGWISSDQSNILWLPEDYRPTTVVTLGHTVVMGHAHGSVSFLSLLP